MTALMAAPAAAAFADMHPEPAADRLGLGQLVLILELDPLLFDLPAALAPLIKRRVELLVNRPLRRPAMTMITMLITRPPP